jgi:hypothetical protein
MVDPDFELIQEGTSLHTQLKSYLEASYGVPRNARRVVVIIEEGKPLKVHAEYHPEARRQPDYGAAAAAFTADRLQKATPSPTAKPLIPAPLLSHVTAATLAGPVPEDVFVVDVSPIKIENEAARITRQASWRPSAPIQQTRKDAADAAVDDAQSDLEDVPWAV